MRKYMTTVGVWMTICCLGLCTATAADDQHDPEMDLELSAEVQALRSEVKELRADIQRLIDHFEVDKGLPTQVEASLSSNPSTDAEQVKEENNTSLVELKLEDCIAVAVQNMNQKLSESEQRSLLTDVHGAYWDLWAASKYLDFVRNGGDNALDRWRMAANRADKTVTDVNEQQARSLYKLFESNVSEALNGSRAPGKDPQGLYRLEMNLRQKIGWAASAGRINPIDEPHIAPLKLDWETFRGQALRNDRNIKNIKASIDQLELKLASAKDPSPIGRRRALAGVQFLRMQLAKRYKELRDAERLVVQDLSIKWRESESLYNALKDFNDQLAACADEVKIYRSKIDQGDVGPSIDALIRAEERRARAACQYYLAVGAYCKATYAIQQMSGLSIVSDASLQLNDNTLQSVDDDEKTRDLTNAIQDIPMVDIASIHLKWRTTGPGTTSTRICTIYVSGQSGTQLSSVVLTQIASKAVESIAGLRRNEVSVIDIGGSPTHSRESITE